MKSAEELLVFLLDGSAYALDLAAVLRVVRMVEIRPLPQAPVIVLGLVDVQGELTPVLDLRRRFRLPAKPASIRDQLIIAKTRGRQVALIVDTVSGLKSVPKTEITAAETILPGLEYLRGVVRLSGQEEMVLIHDLTTFFSSDEETELARALAAPGVA